MTFTDDDLKRLKRTLCGMNDNYCTCLPPCKDTEALLARLEAAEALISDTPQYEPEIEKLRQAWRKVAGR